jgi:hypothetical protein
MLYAQDKIIFLRMKHVKKLGEENLFDYYTQICVYS